MGRKNRGYKARVQSLAIARQKKENSKQAGMFLPEFGMISTDHDRSCPACPSNLVDLGPENSSQSVSDDVIHNEDCDIPAQENFALAGPSLDLDAGTVVSDGLSDPSDESSDDDSIVEPSHLQRFASALQEA